MKNIASSPALGAPDLPVSGQTERETATSNGISKRIIAAAVAGNALEFYDFITYSFFSVYIGRAFFPALTPTLSLLASVAVFGVGFLSRPLGGVLIGAYADRVGRKPAMLLTIALVTLATLAFAFTPSYATIGLAAPVIIVLSRLVQGFALGGEVGPSTAYLIESAPAGKRGLMASWQVTSQGAAVFVAGVIGVILSSSLSPEQLQSWGWRLPFLIGIGLIPVAMYLRHHMPETLHAEAAPSATDKGNGLGGHWRLIVIGVLIIMGTTISTYAVDFMTTYAITSLHLNAVEAMLATVVEGGSICLFAVVGGWTADRFGRKPAMLWPRVCIALITVPLFTLLADTPSVGLLLFVTATLAALTAMTGAASLVAIPELLPPHLRATGLSIVYAVGVSLFGGTTQFVLVWLTDATHNPVAPGWYVSLTSIITILAIVALPRKEEAA